MKVHLKIKNRFQKELTKFEQYLKEYIQNQPYFSGQNAYTDLQEALKYSLNNSAKRLRPLLVLLTAKSLNKNIKPLLPYALAIEWIHTYSLIHDDLPCMDNSLIRRGKPSVHRVYGEEIALLAGNILLVEAFKIITQNYTQVPEKTLKILNILSQSLGLEGLMEGQAFDLRWAYLKGNMSLENIKKCHLMKTGSLFMACTEGSALLCQASYHQQKDLKNYGKYFGLAFQLTDDIRDYQTNPTEKQNLCPVLGLEQTKNYLKNLQQNAYNSFQNWGNEAQDLKDFLFLYTHVSL